MTPSRLHQPGVYSPACPISGNCDIKMFSIPAKPPARSVFHPRPYCWLVQEFLFLCLWKCAKEIPNRHPVIWDIPFDTLLKLDIRKHFIACIAIHIIFIIRIKETCRISCPCFCNKTPDFPTAPPHESGSFPEYDIQAIVNLQTADLSISFYVFLKFSSAYVIFSRIFSS